MFLEHRDKPSPEEMSVSPGMQKTVIFISFPLYRLSYFSMWIVISKARTYFQN